MQDYDATHIFFLTMPDTLSFLSSPKKFNFKAVTSRLSLL